MTLFRGVEIQHSIIGRKMALGVAGSNSISKLLNRTGRQMLRRALSGSEYIGHPWDHWAVIEVVTDLAMNKIRNPIWVSINMYTHFARLHFDSLDMAKLRKALEERFDIRIGESEQFKTVGDAQDTVRKCLAARDQHLLATRMQQIGDTYQSVVEVIKDVLELSKQEIEKVNDRSSLMQDLGADSDALAEVVAAIMDKYEIDIPHEVGENFRTIGDIVEYLNMRAKA